MWTLAHGMGKCLSLSGLWPPPCRLGPVGPDSLGAIPPLGLGLEESGAHLQLELGFVLSDRECQNPSGGWPEGF